MAQEIPFLVGRAIDERPRMTSIADSHAPARLEKRGDDRGSEGPGLRHHRELLIQQPHEFRLIQTVYETPHECA